MTNTLGIDVSSKHLDVALLTSDQLLSGKFTNVRAGRKKLEKWTAKKGDSTYRVCLEATGRYGDLAATYFHTQGYPVHVINPARVKAYRQSLMKRSKTDQEDAKIIAQFGSASSLALWSPPTDHQREIQEISRHLAFLKEERTRLQNRLESGIVSKAIIRSLKQQLNLIDKQIDQLEKKLKSDTQADKTTQEPFELLVSVPGFGELTAASILAEVVDFSRFGTAKQLVSHAGLSPALFESGSSVSKKARISKTGNAHLRRILDMPAIVAMKHNPIIRSLAQRLEKEGKPKKVIICAAMRKLLHIAFGVVKHRIPFDPTYSSKLQITP
mgnify:CR=1 FL=1